MQPEARLVAPALSLLLLATAAAFLSLLVMRHLPDLASLPDALLSPDPFAMGEMRVHYSVLPRLAVSLVCGAALALAGVLMQQVLRNPLASPSTLGVSVGAQFALSVALLASPSLIAFGRDLVAIAGGAAAAALVLALSWRRGLEPFSVVVAGLIVGLALSSGSAALVLHNERYLAGLFLWGSGALTQYDWHVASLLWPRLAVAAVLAALIARPLAMLDLDTVAGALGVNTLLTRLAALGIAVVLTAIVTAEVGVLGFVGLAAPAIARAVGCRRLGARLIWAPLIGALLLTVTDLAVQLLASISSISLPTGAVTAFLGAPVLLWLLPRLGRRGAP
ncbi:iron chelate uptake ABC transporter family permease subunit, partial [Nitratireductor sp. ZSWI3]|uniref:iron chelate uptake ABC transporter family permease subunit n=1 Tax=Nitratireductor sp. ZSWI3 TaxID=2966359 RepID=UPI00214FC630